MMSFLWNQVASGPLKWTEFPGVIGEGPTEETGWDRGGRLLGAQRCRGHWGTHSGWVLGRAWPSSVGGVMGLG